MSAPVLPRPAGLDLAAALRRLRRRVFLLLHPAVRAGLLAEQRHQYRDLDADSACCLPGFSCPACPPKAAS